EEPTEILYLLGEEERIVGISGFTVRPKRAREEKPKVSGFTSANIKKIIELKPDLVIGFSDIQAKIAEELIRNGITVLINNHRTVKEILQVIVQIGSLVGKSERAIQIVQEIQNKIEHVQEIGKNFTRKPKVYFEEWFDPIITGICWVSEIVELAGGEDIFQEHRKAHLAKDRILQDGSEVVRRNPDIILVSWCGKEFEKEKLVTRQNWDQIQAVRNNFIFEIDSSIILQPGPAALTAGLKEISRIFQNWNESQLNQIE
ncbi:MAG: cobalamin-binding protein, partial [Candidatus Pacearchaeota archaeon]